MRKLFLILSASVIALFCNVLQAEIYKDFVPFISLKQVKLNYPNAKFEDAKPAWANEDEVIFIMSGAGLTGETVLKFSKQDKRKAERLAENEAKSLNDNSEALLWWINFDKKYLALPLEERLTLDWVRYVPMTPIPYERLLSRYGKPEKCDSNLEDFRPYCSWESKGVLINLSDDKKLVTNIEYTFTEKEMFPSPEAEPKPSLKKKPTKPKVKKEPASL
jgi:hypothetical protein